MYELSNFKIMSDCQGMIAALTWIRDCGHFSGMTQEWFDEKMRIFPRHLQENGDGIFLISSWELGPYVIEGRLLSCQVHIQRSKVLIFCHFPNAPYKNIVWRSIDSRVAICNRNIECCNWWRMQLFLANHTHPFIEKLREYMVERFYKFGFDTVTFISSHLKPLEQYLTEEEKKRLPRDFVMVVRLDRIDYKVHEDDNLLNQLANLSVTA